MSSHFTVRFLDQTLINQIAAGEVIERPASAIKELVENALDAQATQIEIRLKDGGRTYMSVSDNGKGMSQEDLELCVERHATSKIPDGDLFNIRSFGFRGEALPSIGSVSRLTLTSRQENAEEAWQLTVEGGLKSPLRPASAPLGTRVEVRDLFFATPVRLKFLKSATTELNYITDSLYRQALSNPHVAFRLYNEEKPILLLPEEPLEFPPKQRLNLILGEEFLPNSIPLNFTRGETTLRGWISIPTFNRSNSTAQYLFVNGRPVKDKLLSTAVKIGYQDVLASNRFPAVVLYLTCPPEEVDINVHPAKAEVRFRDSNLMRGFVIAAIREALNKMPTQGSTILSDKTIMALMPEKTSPSRPTPPLPEKISRFPKQQPLFSGVGSYLEGKTAFNSPSPFGEPARPYVHLPERPQPLLKPEHEEKPLVDLPSSPPQGSSEEHPPLGFAKSQLHDTYIIAEAEDALIIVDQHAAHERIVYEQLKVKLKEGVETGQWPRQTLLVPIVVELTTLQAEALTKCLPHLTAFGFDATLFGGKSLVIREVPTLLKDYDLPQLIQDLASEMQADETSHTLTQTFHEVLADKACRASLRAGRKLTIPEMNALLRQMEKTPLSSQCNHGRPTFLKLSKEKIEALFERS